MRPPGSSVRVRGLAMSCSRAPKRRRAAARQLVGERLGEQRVTRRGQRLVAERGRRVALELDACLQHLERVAVHVAVVVGVLLDAPQRRQLGQHGVDEPELVHQRRGRAPRRRR